MDAKGPKILAIDDRRDSLIALQAVLSDALPSYRLQTGLGGAAGIEIAKAEDPDAILLDIVMPDMDGFEVCRRLKADERTKDIPVIFLTALGTDEESRVMALELGAEGFLSKPWNDQELVAQLRAMVKLKAANRMQRLVKEHLEDLVAERTRELQKELAERKRVEDALRHSNESWGNAFNAITDVVFVISREQDILEINRAGCLALGRDKSEILGKKCFHLMHHRAAPIDGCPCLQSIAARRPCMGEYEDHGRSYGVVAWPNVDARGEVVSLVQVIKDVTQEKQAESERERLREQLRASQKMEAIGSLAGGIAHDFNNMLYVIRTFTDLVIDAIDDRDPRRTQLAEVKKASERAATLIRHLLAFSRDQILEPQPESQSIAQVATRTTGCETILIVEDEPVVCDLAKRVLAQAGYTVMTASNGIDALRVCEKHTEKIHLVLTDVVMPEMGGMVFAEQLAKARPDIKFLYMSGYTDDATDNHGTLDPGTHLITKPFSLTDLRRKVREVLDGNS